MTTENQAPEGAQAQWNDDRMVELRMLRQRVAMQRYELARLKGPNGKGAPAPKALTELQIVELMSQHIPASFDGALIEFARAIEAAHNIPAPKEPTNDR